MALDGLPGRQGRSAGGARGASVGRRAARCHATRAPLPPNERARYERELAAARAQLDAESWDRAWAEGRAMSLEEAVADALAEGPDA